ncbi:hypothetical protein DFJ77DRAFT_280302 [Powellomyces hirtus]|nr:hypothetical protein DFJ77DRAFT_280302 [Powellomyces hirtus]
MPSPSTSIELLETIPVIDPATPWHTLSASESAKTLHSDLDKGLTSQSIPARLSKYGPNALTGTEGATWVKILFAQLVDPMNWLFLALGAASFVLKDYVTGGVLVALAFINLYLSFSQEYAAEKTLAALRNLSSSSATVVRDGTEQQIPSSDIVPGDVVVLTDGNAVPADARLISVTDLETDEALLTGESMPVKKDSATLTSIDEPLGDRINMVYSSTIVTRGRARAIIVSTGMETQIGRIATRLQSSSDAKSDLTRLQKSLYKMYIFLIFVAVAGALIVLAVGKFDVSYELGMYAVTMALSVLPAGLTTVLTVTLVMGGKEMTKHNAIVRKLKCLETLGSVTHIFSDKTGTLTQAKMVVVNCWIGGGVGHVYVEPHGVQPVGDVYITNDVAVESTPSKDDVARKIVTKIQYDNTDDGLEYPGPLREFTLCASLCNLASVNVTTNKSTPASDSTTNTTTTNTSPSAADTGTIKNRSDGPTTTYTTSGSPTEVALQVYAHKLGMAKPSLEAQNALNIKVDKNDSRGGWTLLHDYPFTSTLKRMSVIYRSPDGPLKVLTKGAAEIVLGLCTPDEKRDQYVHEVIDDFARRGLRVVLLASRTLGGGSGASYATPAASDIITITDNDIDNNNNNKGNSNGHHVDSAAYWKSVDRDDVERDLEFLGLAGIYDPPRPESASSVRQAHEAGLSVHMLTGDHHQTAVSIAYQIGIIDQDPRKMTSHMLSTVCTTGPAFDALSDEEIDKLERLPLVVARCSPETKVKMIEASHRRHYISAMTGDGVNDSPSLKIADIGVAMGLSGSDVAKSASDIVLADDNFATIITAIREGRRLYTNIQRFLLYYWVGLFAAAIIVLVNLAVRDPSGVPMSPLTPMMLLFLYLAMTPPAASISIQPASPTIMQEPPRPPTESIFNAEIIRDTVFYSLGAAGICLAAFSIVLWTGHGVTAAHCDATFVEGCDALYRARSTILLVFMFLFFIQSVHCRSYRDPEWRGAGLIKTVRDSTLMGCVIVLTGVLSVFIYIPQVGRDHFKMGAITWEWGVVFGAALLWIVLGDMWKIVKGMLFGGVVPRHSMEQV